VPQTIAGLRQTIMATEPGQSDLHSISKLSSPAARLAALPATVAVVASLFSLLAGATFTWRYYSATPFWDFWNWISDYQAYLLGHYGPRDLIKPHNEHRIATTRLILFVDAMFFHMTGRFVIALNWVLLAGLGVLLNLLSRSPRAVAARLTVPPLVTAALMTSICQWFNLLLPFQIQFVLLCLSTVAAAATLAKATSGRQSRAAAAAWACLAGSSFLFAAFSMAGGLLELPWLVLLLVLRRAPFVPAVVFLVAAAAVTLLFLHGYHTGRAQHLPPGISLSILASYVRFAAGFLGSAFYAYDDVPFVAGYIGLGAFALAGVHIFNASLRQGVTLPGRMLALFAITGSVILMALAAAISRLWVGMDEALSPRYATLSLVFWVSLVSLWPQICAASTPARGARLVAHYRLPLCVSLAGLAACNLTPRYGRDARFLNGVLSSQAVAMRQNVLVPDLFSHTYSGTLANGTGQIAFLHTARLSVFAPGAGRLPASITLPRAPADVNSLPPCQGYIDTAYRLDASRFAVTGWIAPLKGHRTADWVAFLTLKNELVAAVPSTEFRPDVSHTLHMHSAPRAIHTGFSDPLAGADTDVVFRVIGLFANDPAHTCILPAPVTIGPLRVQVLPEAAKPGAAVQTATPAPQGSFRAQDATDSVHHATAAPPEPLFISSGKQAGSTGQASFTVAAGPSSDIIIPFATGPHARGQQIDVMFQDGTEDRQVIPDDVLTGRGRAIAVPRAALARHGGGKVVVVAQDAGHGPDDWLVVGAPMLADLNPAWARLYPDAK